MTLASSVTRGPGGPHALGLARYRSEFPIFSDRVYLNTCSLGALGDRARRKVAEFLDVWQSRGASAWYDVWWEALGDLRARYGRIARLSPPPQGRDHVARFPDGGVSVAGQGPGGRRARRRRESG